MDSNVEIEAGFVNQALLNKCNDLFGQIITLEAYSLKLQRQIADLEAVIEAMKTVREREAVDVGSV